MKKLLWFSLLVFAFQACEDEDITPNPSDATAEIRFQFAFDRNQARLDNLGQPSTLPAGHAAQSPNFNSMSVHYIEFVPNQFTFVGDGAVVYEGPTQTAAAGSDFDRAIIWEEAVNSGADQPFLEIPIDRLPPGTYQYLRASVTYQNANVRFNIINLPAPLPSSLIDQTGTLAGFIGFNTYIQQHQVFSRSLTVNADKIQGFWAFEPQLDAPYQDLYLQWVNTNGIESGQAPPGSTTVVNPLEAFGVELPQGSCIVTGQLAEPLIITGQETEDLKVTLSFSVNNSFEWVDLNNNGAWDLDASGANLERPVDMGLRGLRVIVE